VSKKAVDIVLLPETAITELTITLNAELVERFGSEIVLSKKSFLPHISLAMGCIDSGEISRVSKLLKPTVETIPKRLNLVGIEKTTNFAGKVVSVLKVESSQQIKELHEKTCDIVRPFFTLDATEDMIAGGQASVSTLEWIKNYFDKSANANYSPHITIGYGELTDRPLPRDFAVSCLAICHLGDHCTCAKILWLEEI
jgi:hypothetical protein